MAANFKKTENFALVQNTIDYLACKGKAGLNFTSDEKEFMKELYEAFSWGGRYKGYKEAAILADHYVNGHGKVIALHPDVYTTSVVVKDVSTAMKKFITEIDNDNMSSILLKSTDTQFRISGIAAPLLITHRNVDRQGYLIRNGVLLAEQNNKRLKNADHRFVLQSSTTKSAQGYRTTWRVDSVYDFEPFAKGDITHIELNSNLVLKLDDGLSHYLTKIGVAESFKHYSEWVEDWVRIN